ncbi:MAG: hypothetical protein ACYDG2_06455 [Ruminiclostridium sp.]
MTDAMNLGSWEQLDEKELLKVEGGAFWVPFVALAAAATVAIVLFNEAETAGESIGKAIYYATH